MTIAPPLSATILVVDDLDMIRRMLTRMLTLAGHLVLEAADGAEALALLRSRPAPVDLVLTDVLMPRMNGTELARHVLQEFTGTRIMLMSAYLPEGTATVSWTGSLTGATFYVETTSGTDGLLVDDVSLQ